MGCHSISARHQRERCSKLRLRALLSLAPACALTVTLTVAPTQHSAAQAPTQAQGSAQGSAQERQRERAYKELERAERLKAEGAHEGAVLHYERAYRALPERSILKRIAELSAQAPLSCERQLSAWRKLSERCSAESCPEAWRVPEGLSATRRRCELRLDVQLSPKLLKALKARPEEALTLSFDDQSRGAPPLSMLTSAGAHQITIFLGERKLYEAPISLRESQAIQGLTLSGSLKRLRARLSEGRLSQEPKRAQTPPAAPSRKRKRKEALRAQPKVSRPKVSRPKASQPKPFVNEKLLKTIAHQGATASVGAVAPAEMASAQRGLQLEASLQCQYRDDAGELVAFPDCDGATLSSGDKLRLIIKSSEGAYLYLFLHNAHGERAVLFPERGVENLAKGGLEYALPGEGWYELDDRGGVTERLQLVASKEPIEAFERARGLRLNPELLDQLKRTALRGVVKRGAPAILSERLSAADRVLTTLGTDQVASVRFTVHHRMRED